MDFANFDLTDAADGGVWLHMKSPFDGALLYADDGKQEKPCRVLVRGNHSDEMRALIKAHDRKIGALSLRLAKAESDKAANAIMAQIDEAKEAHEDRLIQCAVMGWENIIHGGKPIERTDEAVLKVFTRKLGDLRAQVFRQAAVEADFFKAASQA